ncbi:helix-turn-helix domain-containing protein [Streptococcus parasanguinis]|jgi:raw score 17.76|uniref:helix-turn-helix domain-containing protein n=1 Tax=Streptococcus parasanguinis TaxID=1318 RepID=UPI0018975E1E|nr:helix-turn-helix transcriptional regulator [Streptococcus parasanguinis]MDB8624693.1 helix-turn-helix transcriptional regulator [Streptococcus parasanguinis]
MFSLFEKIKELCQKRGISINSLEETLGYSRNTIYSMKSKKPNAERLQEIADYFNVSTDYLLGRTDNPRIASDASIIDTDPIEEQTLVMFRKETEDMSDDEKERFNKALSRMMKTARDLVKDDSLWK